MPPEYVDSICFPLCLSRGVYRYILYLNIECTGANYFTIFFPFRQQHLKQSSMLKYKLSLGY